MGVIEINSDLLAITFGVTGGLLTIVGLISIFVSLNTQHSIQKCRELYYEIKGQTFTNGDLSNFYKDYYQYKEIMEEGIPERFTKNILNLAIGSILFVLIIWAYVIFEFSLNYFYFALYSGACFFLLFFISHLIKLRNSSKTLNLPEPDVFFDFDDNRINTLALIPNYFNPIIQLDPDTNNNIFKIKTPFQFKNMGDVNVRIELEVRVENHYIHVYFSDQRLTLKDENWSADERYFYQSIEFGFKTPNGCEFTDFERKLFDTMKDRKNKGELYFNIRLDFNKFDGYIEYKRKIDLLRQRDNSTLPSVFVPYRIDFPKLSSIYGFSELDDTDWYS